MSANSEALRILQEHSIPVHAGVNGLATLLRRSDADLNLLRSLGFRISRHIGRQMVISYKGSRVGLIM